MGALLAGVRDGAAFGDALGDQLVEVVGLARAHRKVVQRTAQYKVAAARHDGLMTGRARRWWRVATVAGVLALGGLVVLFIAMGVDQADKWASTLGVFVAFGGLAVSGYGVLVVARRESAGSFVEVDGAAVRTGDRLPDSVAVTDVAVQQFPRPPGVLPLVWNVPARSAVFTGRDDLLVALRQCLDAGRPVVVQALHGLGGVGKTTLALEYAHRFAADYELVWWVDAEQIELISERFAALAVAAGWATAGAEVGVGVEAARRGLRTHTRWLVIFDNAEPTDDLVAWLPEGLGQVLVTSRNPGWVHIAAPVEVDLFTRAESVTLLRRLCPTLAEADADRVADAVGDLPLAVAQAAGVLTETQMEVGDYLRALAANAVQVLGDGKPPRYPAPLAATVQVAVERLAAEDPAAVQVLRLCALLGQEPVPLEVFTAAGPGVLPRPLSEVATSRYQLGRRLGRLGGYGLAKVSREGLQLHRLTQAVVADLLDPAERQTLKVTVEAMLGAAAPDDVGGRLVFWPLWARLLPHLLAVDLDTTENSELRRAALHATGYLESRGEFGAYHRLATRLHCAWADRLGADHPHTLRIATFVALTYAERGQYERARTEQQDILTRQQRVLGDDHPETLISASNLGVYLSSLGRHEQALALEVDNLARRRRTLGDGNQFTLISAGNVAAGLAATGRYQQARVLAAETLAGQRRLLGDDHLATLDIADTLAVSLSALGEHEQARALAEDILNRLRQLLGEDNPRTLHSADTHAKILSASGAHEQARALYEDTLTRRRRVLGQDHPDTLSSADNLASCPHKPRREGKAG